MTKSIRGTSTFHCEQACDYEKEFNCRSYTYLDNPDGSVAPGGNLCLLSADNRATSHQGSMQFRPRALYAEKDCAYQKWPKQPSSPYTPQFSQSRPSSSSQMRFHEPEQSSSVSGQSQPKPPTDSRSNEQHTQQQQINPRNMGDHESANPHDFNGPMGSTHDMSHLYYGNHSQSAQTIPPANSVDDITQMQHIPPRCGPNEYSFEKTFGYDMRYARRERAPIPSRPGVITYCREECLRMSEQCLAFVVEYGEKQQQNCYFLDEAAMENRNQLNKMTGSSYNEKICLRGEIQKFGRMHLMKLFFIFSEKPCGKMWTFERIIGFTLDEPADKEIKSIMLRTACQDLCLAERSFPCRSITYDYGRRICRLFRDTRRSKPNSFKMTNEFVDYMENKCSTGKCSFC